MQKNAIKKIPYLALKLIFLNFKFIFLDFKFIFLVTHMSIPFAHIREELGGTTWSELPHDFRTLTLTLTLFS